jgi:hypothetical protein
MTGWRRGWDSDSLPTLNRRKLFILRSDESSKNDTNAEERYTAGTRTRLWGRAKWELQPP